MLVYSAQDARKDFSEIVSKAAFANEATVITRSGKSVAVVISYDDFEFYRELEDKLDGELATARLAKKGKRLSLEEVKAKHGLE
jgi:prevent-host-death family protein